MKFTLVSVILIPACFALPIPSTVEPSCTRKGDPESFTGGGFVAENSIIGNFGDGSASHIVLYKENAAADRSSFTEPVTSGNGTEILDLLNFGKTQGFIATLTDQNAEALKKDPKIAVIENNAIVRAAATQFNAPYNLARLSKRALPLRTQYFYNDNAGAGVDVYILDSGVNVNHSEFEGRASFGASFTGDGNDDVHGHGTHVAGIVASRTYGVAKKANIIGVKVLNNRGIGNWGTVLSGLNWVFQNVQRTKRKSIVNLSLSGPVSDVVNQAVLALLNAGIVVISAAGNDGSDSCMYSPGSSIGSITVGASDRTDRRLTSPPSNIGNCIDIVAPGSVVISTYIGSNTATAFMSGTSMAAPHVVGVMALTWANRNLTAKALINYVLATASPNIISGFPSSSNNALVYSLI